MLLSSTRRRSVLEYMMGMLTYRLIKSKRMPKARKKLNYEGKNQGHDHLDMRIGCQSSNTVVMYINFHRQTRERTLSNTVQHAIAHTNEYEYGEPATYQISKLEHRDH